MKSSVKAGLDSELTRMRLRALAVLGFGSIAAANCKTASEADGLVAAPMLGTAAPSASDAPADASTEMVRHRRTVDPQPPHRETCKRQVECLAELSSPPPLPYAPPYDRCDPSPVGEVGKFSPGETASHRRSDPTTCCYLAFVECESAPSGRTVPIVGRALRDERGQAITAPTTSRSGWESDSAARTRDETQAEFWSKAAAYEHASVAEFARISLVLLRLGAPAALVADVHRAALDEIAHAQTCFSIASRFAGRALGPGPLDVPVASIEVSVEALVASTLRDGCMGETVASLELHERAKNEADREIAAACAAMAEDETRHAELAWRILRFAADADPAATARAIDVFSCDVTAASGLERRVLDAIVEPCAVAVRNFALQRARREGDCAREA